MIAKEINSIEIKFSDSMKSLWGATKGVGWDNFIDNGETDVTNGRCQCKNDKQDLYLIDMVCKLHLNVNRTSWTYGSKE